MYSVYGYMDSYPQIFHSHRDPAPYPQPVYPSWESPFNGTSRYFSPGECNGFWNHNYPPAPYNSRPPHPHLQPLQDYFHGAYPPYPNVYPTCFVPPPQYFADQGRSHCCGCPNHSCQKNDDSSLKIEEEKPQIESKDNDGSSSMIRWPGYPYPLVWFPPDVVKDNDYKTSKFKDNGSSAMNQWSTHPYPLFWFPPDHVKDNDCKASESQQHGSLDSWIPPDVNSLKSFMESGEKKIQNQQNGAKRTQFPLPIIWMPSCDQSQEVEKSINDVTTSAMVDEEVPSKFRIIPINHLDEKSAVESISPSSEICLTLPDKGITVKNISEKQTEDSRSKKLDGPKKQMEHSSAKLSSPEKQKDENHENKTPDSSSKKHASPGRSSKLPPVCLRADPLPRKKIGNGSSSSLSPLGNKENEVNQEGKEREARGSGGLKYSNKDGAIDKDIKTVEVEERSNSKSQKDGTKKIKVVEVKDGSTSKEEGRGQQNKLNVDSIENHLGLGIEVVPGTGKSGDMAEQMEIEKHGMLRNSEEVNLGHFEEKFEDCKNTVEASDEKKMKENTERKRKFSEIDAVVHVQSAYRGYGVRRWEPIKKLKQIARIRDQVGIIKRQICSLETSSEREQLDEKKQRFIGETIMNLLLQLDTIQGLHPSVREMRKCVASDLVSLQEKLDVMSRKMAKNLSHIEVGDAPTVIDSKNDLEDFQCSSTSNLIEFTFPQEKPAQPSTVDIMDYAADKEEVVVSEQDRNLLLGDDEKIFFTLNRQLLPEIRDEQVPYSEKGLMSSQFEDEGQYYIETEEYTRPPTGHKIGIDSMATTMSGLPTREHSCTMLEKPQEFQLRMKDELVRDSRKEDSPAEAEINIHEENKTEPKVEESHEMETNLVEQLDLNMHHFSVTGPVVLHEDKVVLQKEVSVPLAEDLVNIQGQKLTHTTEGLEVSQLYEDTTSRNGASIIQNGEHGPSHGELLDKPLGSCYSVPCAAGFRDLSCSEPTVPEVDVKESGSSSVNKQEPEELSGLESINPEVAAVGGDAEHSNVENWDAPMPASGAGLDLSESGNYSKPPAFLVEQNISEEKNGVNTELPDMKDISIMLDGSMVGSECPAELASPTRASSGFRVLETEHYSLDDKAHERKLIVENEKLREMLEKMLEVGNKQLVMISGLSDRVNDLEKKVARKWKLGLKKHRASKCSCNNLAQKGAVESVV
uniref:BAG family molecular chaperone regulator 6 n=1 Tax=Anthurium amnicola TaxID=1678845 RepID=A0A1D1Z101_9ARAE